MSYAAALPAVSWCSLCLWSGLPAGVVDNAGMSGAVPQERSPVPGEADLVARSMAGDQRAFQELAVRYYRPVCGFLLKRLGRPDLVEDLAQETFLEAYQALKAGTRPERFSSWLFGIAHNRCGKWLRRKRPALFPSNEPPAQAAGTPFVSPLEELEEQQKTHRALEAGLADLSEEVRDLLRRKHHQGQTCEQIAAELGRPVGTVKSQLARAYQSLRSRLGSSGGFPS